MSGAPDLTRVAIVGGGCGGVAAAYWLSSTAALRQRFHVTLYTQGWRLGGKGASGRNPEEHHRIEEHGLHLWMGCYRRAFQLMRAALAADPSPGPTPSLPEAFQPVHRLTLQEFEAGGWKPWEFEFPQRPGDPDTLGPYNLSRLIVSFASTAQAYLSAQLADSQLAPPLRALLEQGLRELSKAGDGLVPGTALNAAVLLDGFNAALDLASRFDFAANGPARRALILANLAASFGSGLAKDVLAAPDPEAAFAKLDETWDFAKWLKHHGAFQDAVVGAPVRALYELTFAYPKGDLSRGALAAGAAVGLALQMIDYKGAPFFRLNGGMGDVVFAPLYRVLIQQGVAVEFFHRLADVSEEDGEIGEVVMLRQAATKGGPYEPFIRPSGADWWPSRPRWDQLKDGDDLEAKGVDFECAEEGASVEKVRLLKGAADGFHHLVLAVPPEVLKTTTAGLAHPAWRAMLAKSDSVATQALQIWASTPTPNLGWREGMVMSTFASPFATWADMTHVVRWEDWPQDRRPASAHYFCGPLQDGGDVNTAENTAALWTAGPLDDIWRGVPGELTTSLYVRANTTGSERYVLVLPGRVAHRLAPDGAPYRNLSLAGDWTLMRFSGGCVENAVESGLIAARHISGDPLLGGA